MKFITDQQESGPDYQRWLRKFIGFDFEIQFKPGVANRVVDVLSRRGNKEVILVVLVTSQGVDWTLLEREIVTDKVLQQIKDAITRNDKEYPGYSIVDNRLLFKGRYIIPQTVHIIPYLLKEYHDSAVGGHFREVKPYLKMAGD